MILYLAKIHNKDFFTIGTLDNILELSNIHYDSNNIFYYTGYDDDLISILNSINHLFKKYLIDDTFFDFKYMDKIFEYIDYQTKNYDFSISNKNVFKINQTTPSKELDNSINYPYDIFCCFVYDDENILITLKNAFNDDLFLDDVIDKNKSIILKFNQSIDARNFFNSIFFITKKLNNKLDSKNFSISSENAKNIHSLILNNSRNLINIMDFKTIYLSENKILDFTSRKTFSSDEVCKLLGIDRQLLSYWRKSNKIKFKKLSDKKFIYQKNHVFELLENMMIEDKIKDKDLSLNQNNIVQPPKLNKKIEKLKASINNNVTETQDITPHYDILITNWIKSFTHKIIEYKYDKQKFFLNFGNLGFISSPQVMINDNFQLVDYIKKKVIKSTPEETWEYLNSLKNLNLQPRIDSSKLYNDGYKKLYLNNLRTS